MRVTRTREALNDLIEKGYLDGEASAASRMSLLDEEIERRNREFESIAATRIEIISGAIVDAQRAIAQAEAAKKDALSAQEKELRWAISSIWNADVQDDLNKKLTEQKVIVDEECNKVAAETF